MFVCVVGKTLTKYYNYDVLLFVSRLFSIYIVNFSFQQKCNMLIVFFFCFCFRFVNSISFIHVHFFFKFCFFLAFVVINNLRISTFLTQKPKCHQTLHVARGTCRVSGESSSTDFGTQTWPRPARGRLMAKVGDGKMFRKS